MQAAADQEIVKDPRRKRHAARKRVGRALGTTRIMQVAFPSPALPKAQRGAMQENVGIHLAIPLVGQEIRHSPGADTYESATQRPWSRKIGATAPHFS